MIRSAVSFPNGDGATRPDALDSDATRVADAPANDGEPASPLASLYWQRFDVAFDYPVAFTRELLATDNSLLVDVIARREPARRHRCLIYIDANVALTWPDLNARLVAYFAAHAERLQLLGSPVVLPGGEVIKRDINVVQRVLDDVQRHGVDRQSFVIAIGGGALLDAVGLAAGVAHRGVRLVRLPTTVLSQNDSGVGVKNAINFRNSKNFIGTFAPPWAVLNDFDFLSTLPRRDRLAGLSEAIKVALIRDASFFDWLEVHADRLAIFDAEAEEAMIRRSAALHLQQIGRGGDPFELGSARPLDYGHWSAHKLETLTHNAVSHGDAVAIGIALDARYAVLAGLLPAGVECRLVWLLKRLGLPLFHPQLLELDDDGRPALLKGLREFREHLGGDMSVTMLAAVGRGVEVDHVDEALVIDAIEWLQQEARCHAPR
ncbi:3-dehydroquinate synthase [Salinicola aestuarinus]|uniref:3-dehydroquinate synthase n=1 Tax=Salinicola aestuarinus TaxID=1949082 RepID=UPI000DA1A519|nr:3-dehydroquinate synthase [Salinicola aestuarinus]